MRIVILFFAVIFLLGCFYSCAYPARNAVYSVSGEAAANKAWGSCKKMQGECRAICLFAQDASQIWTDSEAEQALYLLEQAAKLLEEQAERCNRRFYLCCPQNLDSRQVLSVQYSGDFSGSGEDGMLVNSAAEEWLKGSLFTSLAEDTAYIIFVNAAGQSYALPRLTLTETELCREKVVVYVKTTDVKQLAALIASLFGRDNTLFDGEIWNGENFSKEFIQYLDLR